MVLQLPSEAHGTAAGVLIYSVAALICSALVVWLTWSHRERTSYVALIGYLLLASTASAVATQLHTFVAWEDVATAQWEEAIANPKSPEQIISNGAVGGDLALWYFLRLLGGSDACPLLGLRFTAIDLWLDGEATYENTIETNQCCGEGQFHVAACRRDQPLASEVGTAVRRGLHVLGQCFLYVQSRRQLLGWDVQYGAASGSFGFSASNSQGHGQERRGKSRGIYDRWLMTRFSIAFVILSIFELSNMLFQFTGMQNSNKDATRSSPDISAERAKETAVLFLPGPAPSFLFFIVFGTTAPFRKHMYRTFVPKRWQWRRLETNANKRTGTQQSSRHGATAPNAQDLMPTLPREHMASLYRPAVVPRQRGIPLRDLEKALLESQRCLRMTSGRYCQYNDRGIRT
ncbi:hypothetical protein PG991_000369 [Apiospora marii]|uniref:Uncharacterized protein n=1 Tax=Apiospora marii TaxID=335849 RepID=A0ABR1T3F4_9PEZI